MIPENFDEAADSGLLQPRLVRRLHLVARRMLFVALVLPVALLHIAAWLLVIMCELGWVILGYVSGRTEHEWLQWTERLLDWMQDLGDRVTSLNSLPNRVLPPPNL